jgi:Ca2+-binding EF-hand superfamily protein
MDLGFLPKKRPLIRAGSQSVNMEDAEKDLSILFQEIDTNHDGVLSQEEFVNGLLSMPFVDISPVESVRLFTTFDKNNSGTISLQEFVDVCRPIHFASSDLLCQAARHIRWIRTLVKIFVASKEYHFVVPETYNYQKSTMENYQGQVGIYVGDYADIRETRDYSYHKNFISERQQWQDVCAIVSGCPHPFPSGGDQMLFGSNRIPTPPVDHLHLRSDGCWKRPCELPSHSLTLILISQ